MKTTPDWQFASDRAPPAWVKTNRVTGLMLFISVVNLMLAAAAPLARLYLDVPGYPAFRVMLVSLLIGLGLAFLALVIFIFSLVKKISPAGHRSLIILLAGIIPPAAGIAYIGPEAIQRPMIHDITTDTRDPPAFREVEKRRSPGQNSVEYAGETLAERQRRAYPNLHPIITGLNRQAALDEAVQVVKDLRWEFINVDYDKGIIEAYDTTRLFGFVDDIIIRVRREGRGSRVDIRSASRVGKGDLGKNAERIRQFIAAYRG